MSCNFCIHLLPTPTIRLLRTYVLCTVGGKFGVLTLGGALWASPFPATQAWTSVLALVHRAPSGWSASPLVSVAGHPKPGRLGPASQFSHWGPQWLGEQRHCQPHPPARVLGGLDSGLVGALAFYPYFSPIHQRV